MSVGVGVFAGVGGTVGSGVSVGGWVGGGAVCVGVGWGTFVDVGEGCEGGGVTWVGVHVGVHVGGRLVGVLVGTLGTYRRCPVIMVDDVRQLAAMSWATVVW